MTGGGRFGWTLVIALAASAMTDASSGAMAKTLPVCPIANGATAHYDIIRDGRTIGRHVMRFALAGPDLTVTTDVEASLSALGIRVYAYKHHGVEHWHGGQMVSLVTQTDDDGTATRVDAHLNPADGTWRGTKGPAPGASPLMASTLWNSLTLQQTRLMDHETGEITPIHTTPQGEETVHLADRHVTAQKFQLTGGAGGTLWYDDAGCWVKARFKSPVDGSMIEVRSR